MYTEFDVFLMRNFIARMTRTLAGRKLNMDVMPIRPSLVRVNEAKMAATGVQQSSKDFNVGLKNFLRGASTIQNYAKAAVGFDVQNEMIQNFCKLLSLQTGNNCGIIMGPSKKETSALKKYWAGGKELEGWQGDFKDLCRCTIVCYKETEYKDLPGKIEIELANKCYDNLWVIVGREKGKDGSAPVGGDIGKVRKRNDADKDLGYTDTNITLILPNGAAVEVQVNIQSTLYGKMGRPAFIEEACPPRLGEVQYAAMEQKKRLPGGCGHILYEVFKDMQMGQKANMTLDEVRQLSRDYYDHLSTHKVSADPDKIVQRLTELSKSDIWKSTYQHTQAGNPRNLPAFRPGTKWKSGDRV